MARPKGPEQRVPVKMRVNIGLMDRLRQLAAENRYSVPKMLTVIMEETLADLPADYELHEMAEIYTLTKNHAVNLSSNRMNVYLLPGTQEAMLELAHRLNASIGAVRTSFVLDYLDLAEEFIKFCVQWALDNCADDVKFLNDMFDTGLVERLQGVLKESFVRLPYTEGIRILEEAVAKGHKFEFPVYWGVDLASEHERYLVEEHFKRPVILTDYPKEIKAFYMKQNEDGKTVRAMDVLFPKIGEIIGGSEREADYAKLMNRIEELHIPMKDMWWYLDTRKFGTCPHSGFGLGFERLLLFVTGMTNIRDVIPFPRTPRNAEF